MKITVVGTGYVGLSLATLISKKYEVIAVDIIEEKVKMIQNGVSPIVDKEIQEFLSSGELNLKATTDISECKGSDFVIVATPTNYDPETHYFNTKSVEGVIAQVNQISPESTVVIKSTIPIDFTVNLCKDKGYTNVMFSPEFLREGKALYDNLHPSRIIAGIPSENLRDKAERFVRLLAECCMEKDVTTMIIGSTEAESVKLFSNTYLAMRVAYFNELDMFAQMHGLNAQEIITGVCLDPRVGSHYNNPSFGYGGYCLPKDTKQLLANYENVPNSLITAIVESNKIRKTYIADEIDRKIGRREGTVGIFRLIMKSGSDNFRESSVMDIMKDLASRGLKIVVYEPTVKDAVFDGWEIVNDLGEFYKRSDVILANRITDDLKPYTDKVFCRDIFNRD
ncbi:MAG: nucleotide sugar dehydrogenase [archaeon]|nr:nucleotide sugar dehydrogenase [archaeon]